MEVWKNGGVSLKVIKMALPFFHTNCRFFIKTVC